jgi:predicted SAM-dependent methyltransferase
MNDKSALDTLLKIYNKRDDLQEIFPEVKQENYQSLINWAADVLNNKFDDECYDLLEPFSLWYAKNEKTIEKPKKHSDLILDTLRFTDRMRWKFSKKYVLGKGIEIGALHRPLPVHKCVQVIYIDKIDVTTAYTEHYSKLKEEKFTNVDVLDDGEILSTIPIDSCDFIIANHFIEHTENPINTIKTHLSRIRTGGILYYIIPDKRKTFDIDRPITSFEHVLDDYQHGPEISRDDHFQEWSKIVKHVPENQINEYIKKLKSINFAIHFHVWDAKTLREFFEKTNKILGNKFVIEEFVERGEENIVILRKIKSEAKEFEASLDSTAPLAVQILIKVYEERQDLQKSFPEVKKGKNLSNLIQWAKKFGINEDLRLYRFSPYYEMNS